ncbi:hypothetical protein [Dyadobacter psychrotolerans]|uniref:Uncharacterized protein n=1 Tax=Dyadobacter psychrotolerans TaxID=2541721 RepID=A0A4R5DSS0_9BACT|nr:hypothetical protein [Dyadobacter psychrotolerans]TDE15404.1 hypothetical protein E0F88_12900 [Dyadobacter psychrotolerans]
MTGQEHYALFSKAMNENRIVRYENETSRDDYHTYAIRETAMGYMFFCLLETFFRTGKNLDSWIAGSLRSFHEFRIVKGASIDTLYLTEENYQINPNYKKNLPVILPGESNWITID